MKRIWWIMLLMSISKSTVAAELPSQRLDLSCWKLTLPENTDRPGKPDEITGKELGKFQHPRYFRVAATNRSVLFRAPCDGVTTRGSKYPRCELREMKPGGRDEANWGTADGKRHTLVASLAILETPVVKKHVVCAQVHHPDDDLLMVRLEGKKLFVERNDLPGVRLDSNYKLGTRFSIKIEAEGGHVKVWYNDQLKMDWVVSQQGCYFKAGCYTQSNTTKGDLPTAGGEVAIYRLVVFHQ